MGSPASPSSSSSPTPRRISTVDRSLDRSLDRSAITVKKPIDLQEALFSTIRAWLAARDAAIWTFCSGLDGDTLTEVHLDSTLSAAADKMNRLRTLALEFASQVDERRTGQAVLAESVESLLSSESPKFLLRLDHLPEAF